MINKKAGLIIKFLLITAVLFMISVKKNSRIRPFNGAKFPEEVLAQPPSGDEKIYPLDIGKLEKAKVQITREKDDVKYLSEDIRALNGKKVRVTGYLLVPYASYVSGDNIADFAVGKYPYGCPCCDWGSSPLPTVFNTVSVTMKKGEDLSEPLSPMVEATGVFLIHPEYYTDESGKKQLEGLFFVKDASAKKKKKLF